LNKGAAAHDQSALGAASRQAVSGSAEGDWRSPRRTRLYKLHKAIAIASRPFGVWTTLMLID
jgi:hypothetical protein